MSDTNRIEMGIGYILCLLSIMALVLAPSAPYPIIRVLVLFMAGIAAAYGIGLTLRSVFRR